MLLPVRVGGSWYTLDVSRVVEVLDWESPMPLPTAPDYVLGVLARRGHTVPVIRLSLCLGLEETPTERGAFPRIVVVNVDGMRVGCLCDQVLLLDEDTPTAPEALDICAVVRSQRVGR